MDKLEIINILYNDIMIEAPRDIVNMVVSYLTFLPRKCVLSIDEYVHDIGLCSDEKIIVFTNTSIDVYECDNCYKIATHNMRITSVIQYTNHEWFALGSETIIYVDTNNAIIKWSIWPAWLSWNYLNIRKWKIKNAEKLHKIYDYIITGWANFDIYKFGSSHFDFITTITCHEPASAMLVEINPTQQTWCLIENEHVDFYKDLTRMCSITTSVIPLEIGRSKNNELILSAMNKQSKSVYYAIFDYKIEPTQFPQKLLINNMWETRHNSVHYYIPNSQNMNFGIPHECKNDCKSKFVNIHTNEEYQLTDKPLHIFRFHDDTLVLGSWTKTFFFRAVNS